MVFGYLSTPSYRSYVTLGATAVALVVILQLISLYMVHDGRPEQMLRLPHEIDGALQEGFDGQFFLLLADDPLVSAATADALDSPVLRATRIAYPLAGRLLSYVVGGTKNALLILQPLSALTIILVLQMAAWRRGLHPSFCLVVPLTLPFVLSLELATAELPAAALLVLAAKGFYRRRPLLSFCALALACLTKEVVLLAVLAFVIAYLLRRDLSNALFHAVSAAPLAAWYVYLHLVVAPYPQGGSLLQNLTLPGSGVGQALLANALALLGSGFGAKPLGLLAGIVWHLVGLVIAVRLVWRRPTPAGLLMVFGGFLVLALSYGPPSHALDEVFNFGRQLFLLPVGALLAVYFDPPSVSPRQDAAAKIWLFIGAVLGFGWWLQNITG